MRSVNRNRIVYGLLTISTVCMGLASRHFSGDMPFVKTYVGDALWSLMVFFGFAFTFNQWPLKTVTLLAFVVSFGIEISQLYHAPWIDSIRATRIGGLVLGFTFVWSDFLCYSAGIVLGVFVEKALIPARFRNGLLTTRHPNTGI